MRGMPTEVESHGCAAAAAAAPHQQALLPRGWARPTRRRRCLLLFWCQQQRSVLKSDCDRVGSPCCVIKVLNGCMRAAVLRIHDSPSPLGRLASSPPAPVPHLLVALPCFATYLRLHSVTGQPEFRSCKEGEESDRECSGAPAASTRVAACWACCAAVGGQAPVPAIGCVWPSVLALQPRSGLS